MKLSKSKLALAKVINENGGWVDDSANWAAQPKHGGGDVWFSTSESKPYSPRGCGGFTFTGYGVWLGVVVKFDKLLGGWHQAVLSREEYYQAYPKADADGWIEWSSDELPVEKGTIIDVKYSDGDELHGAPCGEFTVDLVSIRGEPASAEQFGIFDDGVASIIAYRLHKPEVKPELCESAMRGIPEPDKIEELAEIMGCNADIESIIAVAKSNEDWIKQLVGRELSHKEEAKPTIEQLAQDYRNARDHAEQLQDEANKAWIAAEKIKGELVDAGNNAGLVVSPHYGGGSIANHMTYRIGESGI